MSNAIERAPKALPGSVRTEGSEPHYGAGDTGVSALVAIVFGGVETAALIARKLDLTHGRWKFATPLWRAF
jgi:hypothetical protein